MPARRHHWIIPAGCGAIALIIVMGYLAMAPVDFSDQDEPQPPAPAWAEPAPPPAEAASPRAPGVSGRVDPSWLADTARRTGIPERALAAYAGVALDKAADMPECGLGWNTLAAVGHAESRHGTHGGSELGPDGTVTPGIYGIALVGGATESIPDSDGGAVDGDADWDRAVGPMQLIPQTWQNWHVDANADGAEDPQNIDDAALASANYLCRASENLDTRAGWIAGITAYNSDPDYLVDVAGVAVDYASDVAE
jgi:membrane-bound lytic murein transglycosylase B